MVELYTSPSLQSYSRSFGTNTRLFAPEPCTLISLAIPLRGKTRLAKCLSSELGIVLPCTGHWSGAKTLSGVRCLAISADQLMLLVQANSNITYQNIQTMLGDSGYITDQSDNWVSLIMDGSLTSSALERLCQIDLDSSVCPATFCSRTIMEHLPIILVREAQHRFLLMTLTSYADSFQHTLETALHTVS